MVFCKVSLQLALVISLAGADDSPTPSDVPAPYTGPIPSARNASYVGPTQIYQSRPHSYRWEVSDPQTYNSYGQQQETDGSGNTKGSYKVALADGRIQTVTYAVDPYGGYKADVQYAGEAKYFPSSQYKQVQPSEDVKYSGSENIAQYAKAEYKQPTVKRESIAADSVKKAPEKPLAPIIPDANTPVENVTDSIIPKAPARLTNTSGDVNSAHGNAAQYARAEYKQVQRQYGEENYRKADRAVQAQESKSHSGDVEDSIVTEGPKKLEHPFGGTPSTRYPQADSNRSLAKRENDKETKPIVETLPSNVTRDSNKTAEDVTATLVVDIIQDKNRYESGEVRYSTEHKTVGYKQPIVKKEGIRGPQKINPTVAEFQSTIGQTKNGGNSIVKVKVEKTASGQNKRSYYVGAAEPTSEISPQATRVEPKQPVVKRENADKTSQQTPAVSAPEQFQQDFVTEDMAAGAAQNTSIPENSTRKHHGTENNRTEPAVRREKFPETATWFVEVSRGVATEKTAELPSAVTQLEAKEVGSAKEEKQAARVTKVRDEGTVKAVSL